MAKIFISYSHADREFVRRLAQDLTNQAVEVWLDEWRLAVGQEIKAMLDEGIAAYDYFLILLSATSITSGWVRHELDIALRKEADGRSGFVVPILLNRVEPPLIIAERPTVDFTGDYATGLQALIGMLAHVSVRIAANSPRVRVISARRGIRTLAGLTPFREEDGYVIPSASLHRIAMVGLVSDEVSVWSVLESIGDPRVALELTNGAAHIVGELFKLKRISRDRDDITRVFNIVDAGAKALNQQHGLRGVNRVACKMALLVWAGDGASVAAVGKTGTCVFSKSEIELKNARFEAKFGTAIRSTDGSAFIRAPLGYLFEGSLQVEQHGIDFQPGDFIALTSFALPAHAEDVDPLVEQLSDADDLPNIARRLTAAHWPPVADAFVCLVECVSLLRVE
jgi:hypothetical protein